MVFINIELRTGRTGSRSVFKEQLGFHLTMANVRHQRWVEACLRFVLHCFSLRSLIFSSFLSCAAATGTLPGVEHDYGISPKFVCTPIPPDADASCYPPPSVAHGPSSNGNSHNGSNRRSAMSDEAKATILHLRESLVRQKETILDQRETIRELTAKLTLCESFGAHHGTAHHDNHHETHHVPHHENHHDEHHGHHSSHPTPTAMHHGPSAYHSSDHHVSHSGHRSDPHGRKETAYSKHASFSPEQTGKTLQTLKERLESLQARNSSSSYSSSLRELLQRKISAMEEQLQSYYQDHHNYGHHNDNHGDHHNDHHSGSQHTDHHDEHHGGSHRGTGHHDDHHGTGHHDDHHGTGHHDDHHGSSHHDDHHGSSHHDDRHGTSHHDNHHNHHHSTHGSNPHSSHNSHPNNHHYDHHYSRHHGYYGNHHGSHHDDHHSPHDSHHHDAHHDAHHHDAHHDAHHHDAHHDAHHHDAHHDAHHHDAHHDAHHHDAHHDSHHTPDHYDDHHNDHHGNDHHEDHHGNPPQPRRLPFTAKETSLQGAGHSKMETVLSQLHHGNSDHGTHKKLKSPSAFMLDFPMRTNYMYARMKRSLVSELFALTVCLWLKAGAGPGLGTPFSYAVAGQANELVLVEWGSNPMELLVNDKAATLPITMTDDKWHHVCVTWSTRDGVWEAYQDGAKKGTGQNLSAWHSIRPGGVFILGQEQDTVGGRFDTTQSFMGELSDLQVWSRVLTPSEVSSQAACGGHLLGDVMSWSEESVELHGGLSELPFDPCH